MPVRRHTHIYNICNRRRLKDAVGIMIQGKLFYHNTNYWIEHDPLALWQAIQHQKIRLNRDVYYILKNKMRNLYPEIVEAGAERKAKASMLIKARKALGDPNLKIAD